MTIPMQRRALSIIFAAMLLSTVACSASTHTQLKDDRDEIEVAESKSAGAADADDAPERSAEPPSPADPPAPDNPAPVEATDDGEISDEPDRPDQPEDSAEGQDNAESEEVAESDRPDEPEDSAEGQDNAEIEAQPEVDADDIEERAVEVIEDKFGDHYGILSPIHIEGWTFIRVRDERLSHPRPRCEVVRTDATLVGDDKAGELLQIFAAMGVFDGELPSAYDMALAASALVGDCRTPARADTARRRDGDFSDTDITAPEAERDGDTVTLLYFATGSDYRDQSIYRGKVVVTADEILSSSVDTLRPDDDEDDEILDLF